MSNSHDKVVRKTRNSKDKTAVRVAIIAGVFAVVAACIGLGEPVIDWLLFTHPSQATSATTSTPPATSVAISPSPMPSGPVITATQLTPAERATTPISSIPALTGSPSVPAVTATSASRTWQTWTQIQSFPAPGDEPGGIVRIGDNLWVNVPCSNQIYRLDLEGNLVAELEMPQPGCGPRDVGLAWDGTSLWGIWWSKVIQIDPNTGQALSEFEVDLEGRSIAWDATSLWVVDLTGNLSAYDRNGQRARRLAIPVFGVVSAITWVNGELWMLDGFGKVTRFNDDFLEVGVFSLALPCGISSFHGHKTFGLYWDGDSLWVADAIKNRIFQCASVD